MNEATYKDKFNAQMKKAGIDSLDDLKTDAEKKAFFKAVDKSHDAVNESVDEILAIAEEMKDLEPDAEEINAMVKDPHKSKEGNPKDDILAMWSKESVKADVKAKGGADMAKVQDKSEMMYAMKQINAMYKENKYLPTKDGSINDAVAQMQIAEQKTVTVRVKEFSQMVETYLARGGVRGFINTELTEGKQVLPLKEVRAFIDTYNRHFLTNYRAEEFIVRDRLNEGRLIGLPKGRALMYIIKTDKNTASRIKSFLADNGERYPIHIDDDDSGQITLDAYDDRDAAHDAATAISKKFNVTVKGTR